MRRRFWLWATPVKLAFRRRFPARQDAFCSNCGANLSERQRRPCPVCGDTRRIFERGLDLGGVHSQTDMG